jgi:hypothetical protein
MSLRARDGQEFAGEDRAEHVFLGILSVRNQAQDNDMDSTESAPRFGPPRVLFINIRGLSPLFLGPYGNEWVHTPTFDRLAARGIVFDQHFATNLDHEIDRSRPYVDLADKLTVGVKSSFPRERHTLLSLRRKLHETIAGVKERQPAFCFVEIDALLPPWEPHAKYLRFYFGNKGSDDDSAPLTPWTGPLPDSVAADDDHTLERLQDTFGAVMSALDHGLAKLLAGCRQRGFGQNAMIVVTSDLAFPLGEQGPVGWGNHGIIEGVAHLPLFVRLPGNQHAGMRVAGLTEPGDLVQTLQSFLAGKCDGGLWPLIRNEKESLRDHLIIRHDAESAVRTTDRFCVFPNDGTPRLYIKPEDRFEILDLASKREDEVQALSSLLK